MENILFRLDTNTPSNKVILELFPELDLSDSELYLSIDGIFMDKSDGDLFLYYRIFSLYPKDYLGEGKIFKYSILSGKVSLSITHTHKFTDINLDMFKRIMSVITLSQINPHGMKPVGGKK